MLVYAINLLITGSRDLGLNETGLGLTASNSPIIPWYALEPVINIYNVYLHATWIQQQKSFSRGGDSIPA